MMKATVNGHKEVARILMDAGANANDKDEVRCLLTFDFAHYSSSSSFICFCRVERQR